MHSSYYCCVLLFNLELLFFRKPPTSLFSLIFHRSLHMHLNRFISNQYTFSFDFFLFSTCSFQYKRVRICPYVPEIRYARTCKPTHVASTRSLFVLANCPIAALLFGTLTMDIRLPRALTSTR